LSCLQSKALDTRHTIQQKFQEAVATGTAARNLKTVKGGITRSDIGSGSKLVASDTPSFAAEADVFGRQGGLKKVRHGPIIQHHNTILNHRTVELAIHSGTCFTPIEKTNNVHPNKSRNVLQRDRSCWSLPPSFSFPSYSSTSSLHVARRRNVD
jgi:hypothetical protein